MTEEFVFDMWDLDLTDEQLLEILMEQEHFEAELEAREAGTWEGVNFPSPW